MNSFSLLSFSFENTPSFSWRGKARQLISKNMLVFSSLVSFLHSNELLLNCGFILQLGSNTILATCVLLIIFVSRLYRKFFWSDVNRGGVWCLQFDKFHGSSILQELYHLIYIAEARFSTRHKTAGADNRVAWLYWMSKILKLLFCSSLSDSEKIFHVGRSYATTWFFVSVWIRLDLRHIPPDTATQKLHIGKRLNFVRLLVRSRKCYAARARENHEFTQTCNSSLRFFEGPLNVSMAGWSLRVGELRENISLAHRCSCSGALKTSTKEERTTSVALKNVERIQCHQKD